MYDKTIYNKNIYKMIIAYIHVHIIYIMLQVVMVLVSYFQKIILKSLPWESEIIIRYTAVPLLSSSTEMFTARNSIDH